MLEALLRQVLYCGHSTQYSHLVWYVLNKDTCTLKDCTSPYGYWCSSMVGWLITWVNCSIAKWSTDKTWLGDVCGSWSRSHCISWSLCGLKWGVLHPFISLCPHEPKIFRQYWCHFAWVVWLCRNMKLLWPSKQASRMGCLKGWFYWYSQRLSYHRTAVVIIVNIQLCWWHKAVDSHSHRKNVVSMHWDAVAMHCPFCQMFFTSHLLSSW